MARSLKAVCSVLLASVMLLALSSCIKTADARATVTDFFNAVSSDDFGAAESFIHPDNGGGDLREFFDKVEADYGIDFQSELEILGYSSFNSASYDSEVGGSKYSTSFNMTVGGTKVQASMDIIDNDSGYGISYIYFFVPDASVNSEGV